MFGPSYFGPSYFGASYFPPGVVAFYREAKRFVMRITQRVRMKVNT